MFFYSNDNSRTNIFVLTNIKYNMIYVHVYVYVYVQMWGVNIDFGPVHTYFNNLILKIMNTHLYVCQRC